MRERGWLRDEESKWAGSIGWGWGRGIAAKLKVKEDERKQGEREIAEQPKRKGWERKRILKDEKKHEKNL